MHLIRLLPFLPLSLLAGPLGAAGTSFVLDEVSLLPH